jgi:hypothetical protein
MHANGRHALRMLIESVKEKGVGLRSGGGLELWAVGRQPAGVKKKRRARPQAGSRRPSAPG